MKKVALVTGSNKGIGFAIVRALCKQFDGLVYLTARNEELGLKAVKELENEGLKPAYLQLDIDNQESINNAAAFIKQKHGGLDILINNAAIAFKVADTTPFHTQAEISIRINFYGTLNVCNSFFPLLRSHARVVNVSSRAGPLSAIKDEKIRHKLTNDNATTDDIIQVLERFVQASKENKHQELGFPNSAYGTSKIGVTALTRVQQRLLQKDATRSDIIVNACCPGYVATDMSSFKGHLTIDQGAITPVYLALIPENASGPRGEFVADKQVQKWVC